MYFTRIHESTISLIVPEVCQSIYQNLKGRYIRIPRTPRQWEEVSQKFGTMWDFPMCLGAMDGKHIVFRPPAVDGSYYYNYKGTYSIELLAVVDAEYKFLYIDVGVSVIIQSSLVLLDFSARAME
ncbi:uncharacterized protein LOC124162710 [Ischnura elegans]|uniref:uncharacterized protein LOC124162710 n=1 Tax=Ischnura elegans TaxID=197161 RepID=UPI001ED8B638|nr:uncharacterized protein LOC124162710 [Ischnura elegans]